jgi:hypothetical protein
MADISSGNVVRNPQVGARRRMMALDEAKRGDAIARDTTYRSLEYCKACADVIHTL